MITRIVVGMAAALTAALVVRSRVSSRNGRHDYGGNDTLERRPVPFEVRRDNDTRKLVGIIAHELRTPTSVILGYQELLAGGLLGPVNERTGEALERIRRAAGQLRDLTDGLQILTADVPVRHNPDADIANVAEAAARAVEAARPEADARGVALDYGAHAPAPVRADPDGIEQLLDLIIGAALRASTQNRLHLAIRTSDSDVIVDADGVTFDPEGDAAALFDSPDRIASGLGLRLAIAQRIAESLGGSLDLDHAGQLQLRLPQARDA